MNKCGQYSISIESGNFFGQNCVANQPSVNNNRVVGLSRKHLSRIFGVENHFSLGKCWGETKIFQAI